MAGRRAVSFEGGWEAGCFCVLHLLGAVLVHRKDAHPDDEVAIELWLLERGWFKA